MERFTHVGWSQSISSPSDHRGPSGTRASLTPEVMSRQGFSQGDTARGGEAVARCLGARVSCAGLQAASQPLSQR